MHQTKIKTSDTFWLLMRMTMFVLLSTIVWAQTPFIPPIPPRKLLITSIASAIVLVSLLIHSYITGQAPWSIRDPESDLKSPVSFVEGLMFVVWCAGNPLFFLWLVLD
jgi:hypothetical protein